jgi:hypothetical protein
LLQDAGDGVPVELRAPDARVVGRGCLKDSHRVGTVDGETASEGRRRLLYFKREDLKSA